MYFTQEHEDAIVRYCSVECFKTKEKLYRDLIQPVFSQMVDKIVFTYRFTSLPDIDDLRESPAMIIVNSIKDMGFKKIYVVEPHIQKMPDQLKSNELLLTDIDTAIEASQLILILVKHKSFINVKLELFFNKTVIDTVGLIEIIKGIESV